MHDCLVGCCPDNTCDCSLDCECLLPAADKDFTGRLGFDNPSLFPDDDLKKTQGLGTICPCKFKEEISDCTELKCCGADNVDNCCSAKSKADCGNHPSPNGVNKKAGHRHESGNDDSLDEGNDNTDCGKSSCCENKDCETKCNDDVSGAKTPPNKVRSTEVQELHAKPETCCNGTEADLAKKSCCSSKSSTDHCENRPKDSKPVSSSKVKEPSHDDEKTPCCDKEEGIPKKSCCSSKSGSDHCQNSPKDSKPPCSSKVSAKPEPCCGTEADLAKKSCCSSKSGSDHCQNSPKDSKPPCSSKVSAKPEPCCGTEADLAKKSCCSSKSGSDHCQNSPKDSKPPCSSKVSAKPEPCCGTEADLAKKSCCSSKSGSDHCQNSPKDSKPPCSSKVSAKPEPCCGTEADLAKKSCCSSKSGTDHCENSPKDSKPASSSKVKEPSHDDEKTPCCNKEEGVPKKSCCSSKSGSDHCQNSPKDSKPVSSSKVKELSHNDEKTTTCCDKEEGVPKKSCCSSRVDSNPCENGGSSGKLTSSSKVCAVQEPPAPHNEPETKAIDVREVVPKKGCCSSKAPAFAPAKPCEKDVRLNERKQSYPFDEKRCDSDPHHGHEHHHMHEFHHEGGHHHHDDNHRDDHHHDDNHHGLHHHGDHHHDDHHHDDDDHHHDDHPHGRHHHDDHPHDDHHHGHHGDHHDNDHHDDDHHHDDHHHGDHSHDDHQHCDHSHGGHHHDDDHHHGDHSHGEHHHDDGHDHCDGHGHSIAECHGDDDHHGNHVHHDDDLDDVDACGGSDCCENTNCCEDSDCETRNLSAITHEELRPLVRAESNVVVEVELRLQTTKLRVQNMCCPKESCIVEEELNGMEGVNRIRVNVIGRMVHVCHYPDVVSPNELMATLNRRHLGASIVDTGAEETDANGFPRSLKILLGSLAVQAILFSIALGAMFSSGSWYMWVAIVEMCFGIFPVLKKAFHAIRNREIDLNILITVTVIGTLVIQEWIEGAAVVFVFALANFLQQFCFYRVHKTISSLMLSKPSKAVMACTGECIPIENVPVGSIIAVRQGELIPLDGIVVKGSASVDESSISGEAAPVEKTLRSETYSGTVIQHGYLELETTSSSTSSTISKISAMVEDAQMNVSPTEVMVNKFAKYYTPVVVLVAVLVFLFPLVLGLSGVDAYEGRIIMWGERALIVLVTACPCALLMATPIVVICGISGGARLGTLIKGGTFLEALAQLTFLAFDKTGTLTEGKFQVVDLLPVDKAEESEVLRWAAALESKSSHPLAAAVVSEYTGECIGDFAADSEELVFPDVTGFSTMEGQGISGTVEGRYVEIGNHSLLNKLGISLSPKFEAAYITFCSDSKTVVFICVDGELALMISLADIIRWESSAALTWLHDLGIDVAMLTGDSRQTATAVQKELKIDRCFSEMKPDDKLRWITEIKDDVALRKRKSWFGRKRSPVVGMVGDGVNDGPALAAADVGISMAAGGSALAVEAAGVALMTNDVLKVPETICLSRFCRRIILQNIVLAVLLKVVFVVVALAGYVRVWMAVVADLVGLLAVILNGLRPLNWKPPKTKRKKSAAPRASWKRKRPVLQYESVV